LVSLGLCRRLRHPGFLSPAVSLFQLALCHEIGGNRYISSCATHDRLYASRPDRDAAQARSAGLFDIIDELADELRSGGRWRPGRCAVMHHIEKRLVIVDVPDVAETVQESWINVAKRCRYLSQHLLGVSHIGLGDAVTPILPVQRGGNL
jgi:hypothetical protein